MTANGDRPDPEVLLRRLAAEEARAGRARLKVFFGFAPGVGKTYRMLQVARDVAAAGRDVVVGLVETHGRAETEALLGSLEVLPRRRVEYRGQILEEFDLDAALARRPAVLLVDEIAHTNAPGSRHGKRWQDVLELLDAGIDVFTTVNVQHVESLNDVVAQITRVQVRETIPDSLLDRADEIELVDIAPEQLLQRLREGKVYLPDQARRAADHFFRRGNLLALRELALRRTAQHVDADVLAYREQHGVVDTWPAGERIMVCVGPAPSSARLIRAAYRTAVGLRAPWVAAYVEATALGGMSAADRERLESHLRLAESLGGTVIRLTGTRVADTILDYARRRNVTRIVIGKPTHSRLRDRLRGSLVDSIVRGSADIDVHVITGDPEQGGSRPPAAAGAAPDARATGRWSWPGYAFAAALVGLTTLGSLAARQVFPVPDLEVLYLLAVMVTAVRCGRGPSVLAAGLGVAAYDFFFVPPFLTFAVADGRYVLTFGMMFGVGLLVSELTARIRRQEQDALAREERTGALYALARDLGAAPDAVAAAHVVARHAAEVFDTHAFVLRPDEGGALVLAAASAADAVLSASDLGVARWCFEHGRLAGRGTDTLPGAETVCAPLAVGGTALGVLALGGGTRGALRLEQREFLEAFSRQAAFAFERARLADDAKNAALRAKTEEMRSSLLSAVSHDLRTPLAAITGAATSLRDDAELEEATRRDLLESICEEADRLERLVANLLDMTRLETGGVTLRREWLPLEEVVVSALARVEPRLGARPVSVDLPADLPLVSVDPVLAEQLFVNLFENAARHTPPGSPLDVRASSEGATITVEIGDRGPGVRPGDEARVFEKFYRGSAAAGTGVGLGLAICRGIVEAHGGTIQVANRGGGGAVFSILLPIVGTPPALPQDAP